MAIKEFQGQYRFLSNFWPAEVKLDEEKYPTVEHAYQAAKTLDKERRKVIQAQITPGRAKRAGNKVKLRPNWEDVKVGIMLDLVRQKFKNSVKLKNRLLATEDEELVEGNIWGDTFWGRCKGVGQNNLGKILMKVRKELGGNTKSRSD